MKENPTPLPRPPNEEILKHELMRKIEAKLYKIKKEMTSEGKSQEEIEELLDLKRKQLVNESENIEVKGNKQKSNNFDNKNQNLLNK